MGTLTNSLSLEKELSPLMVHSTFARIPFITNGWTTFPRWVGRQESVGPAPPFLDSGGPQTGVWWTKMEGEEFTDDKKIEFEPNKR